MAPRTRGTLGPLPRGRGGARLAQLQYEGALMRIGAGEGDRTTSAAFGVAQQETRGFVEPRCRGAGEGNRTLVVSLEGFCSTIELHPRRCRTARSKRWRSTGLCSIDRL